MHPLENARLTANICRDDRIVAIVKYRDDCGPVPQLNPCVLYQVTIRGDKLSRGGLIRFGDTRGDEIMGWQRREWLEVVEVLGGLDEDGQNVIPLAA